MKFVYRQLEAEHLKEWVFEKFNRYQKVERCWRKENGSWILKDIAFTEQWNASNIKALVKDLSATVGFGGKIIGAFSENGLAGFCSVENRLFGSKKEYVQLSSLHITFELRGKGIGKHLFELACDTARQLGAKKLYISAHSSQETQAFYKAMGCVEAEEINEELFEIEPFDCHLEYVLYQK